MNKRLTEEQIIGFLPEAEAGFAVRVPSGNVVKR